jgi:hypothetical protein
MHNPDGASIDVPLASFETPKYFLLRVCGNRIGDGLPENREPAQSRQR